jgi:enoyl-CoA hydratase/carnithine racemase
MGSGAGICMRAPITIATDNSEWAMPECVAGFLVDNGASKFFAELRNGDTPLGLYLAVTGQRVSGKNLLKWGIANHFVSKDKLDKMKEDLIVNVK